MKKIFLTFIFLISSYAFSQQGWFYLNPTPTATSMSDLTMFSESSGICRGSNSIFRTFNGGATWIEYNFSNSDMYLVNLSMIDSSTGFAQMASGRILKTTAGGMSWSFVSQLSYNNDNVKFISESVGFNLPGDGTGRILRTTNGGVKWIQTYSEQSVSFHSVNFVSPSIGYAVGENQQVFPYRSRILKTTNSGTTWDSIPTNLQFLLYKVFFINESTGFLKAQKDSYTGRILRTTDGGLSWRDTVKNILSDIRFFDSNTGYFLADDTLLGRTTNAGANWTISKIRNQTINYNTKPTQLCFVNQTNAVCIGTLGLNLISIDNGASWTNYNNSFTSDELDDIIFKDANTGFAMGFSKNIFKTTNGGSNWKEFAIGDNNSAFGAMAYAGGNTWYLTDYFSNASLYKTTNDGLNWSISSPGFSSVTALQFLNENTGFGVCKYNTFVKTTNGGLNWYKNSTIGSQNFTVNFVDENTGYVGGGGKLRKTTDGGITFDTIPRSIIYSAWDVKFLSRDTIVVNGFTPDPESFYRGTVWKSTNGGINWNAQYISHQYIQGPLRFPNSTTGYIYDGYGSMYKSTNAGDNWFQIKAPDSHIYGMNFLNAETGFICGNYGVIAKTTDGGVSTFINSNEIIPQSFSLYQNYPNPFNPSTKIKFDLPQKGSNDIPAKIIIFDILGRELETLLDENLTAGMHEVSWNASRYAAGVYFYMLLTDGAKETKKMILVK